MKKHIIMSSSFALALSALSFQGANAELPNGPNLKISGVGKVGAFFFKNSNKEGPNVTNKAKAQHDNKGQGHAFALQDTGMFFDVNGRLDGWGQLEWDWIISLNLDSKKNSGQKVIEENALALRGDWGLVKFGDHQGVENFMATGAFVAAGGTGGANGNFDMVANKSTGIYTTTDLTGKTSYATKITYVTPRIHGLQLGVSHTPNSNQSGENDHTVGGIVSSKGKPQDLNSWAGGVNYSHKFENDLKMVLSFTGLYAKTRERMRPGGIQGADNELTRYALAKLHNTKSMALGAFFELNGLEFGAEYVDNGKSQQFKNPNDVQSGLGGFDAGKAYDLAVGYNYGPNKVSAGYYESKRKYAGKDAKAKVISLAFDRSLGKGLGFYVEVVQFDFDTPDAGVAFDNTLANHSQNAPGNVPSEYQSKGGIRNNRGHVVSTGFKVSF